MGFQGKIYAWLVLLLLQFGHCGLNDLKTDMKDVVDTVRKEQISFCLEKPYNDYAERRIIRSSLTVDGKKVPVYVFGDESGVSDCVKRGDGWETYEITLISDFLENYMKRHNIGNPRAISVIDIGVNVGVYGLTLGAKGYRVFGFDPSWYNVYTVRRSICENPAMDFLLFGYGLSNNDTVCEAYALSYFLSNYVVCCGGLTEEIKEQNRTTGDWRFAQNVELRRLDNFAESFKNVVAIKLDVEGYEPYVLEGGMKVLLGNNVSIIMMEYNAPAMRRTGRDPHNVVETFIDAGFALRFGDKAWETVSLEDAFTYLDNRCSGNEQTCNLFLIRQTELESFKVSKPYGLFSIIAVVIVVAGCVLGIVFWRKKGSEGRLHEGRRKVQNGEPDKCEDCQVLQ